jgi:hypothetical protein
MRLRLPDPARKKVRRLKRAHILLVSLNMNGRLYRDQSGKKHSKWKTINREVRDRRIGILALQETHLDEKEMDHLRKTYGQQLVIMNSALPDKEEASKSAGVAFVLKK